MKQTYVAIITFCSEDKDEEYCQIDGGHVLLIALTWENGCDGIGPVLGSMNLMRLTLLNDIKLKKKIGQWWGENLMEYHVPYPRGTREYFDAVDMVWKRMDVAFFGAKNADIPIFSSVIPYESLKGKWVLEIGFGVGSLVRECAKQGVLVTGIDIAQEASIATKKSLRLSGLKGDIAQGDAENLPFRDNSFDYVYSYGVLHHTPNTQKAINEIYRVLKHGGGYSVILYNKHSFAHYGIVFVEGILKGNLFRSAHSELVSRFTDGAEIGGNPLAKVYSQKQVKKLFSSFADNKAIIVSDYGIRNIRILGRIISELPPLYRFLVRHFGWLILIQGQKPGT